MIINNIQKLVEEKRQFRITATRLKRARSKHMSKLGLNLGNKRASRKIDVPIMKLPASLKASLTYIIYDV